MLGCSSAEVLGPVQTVVAVLSGARVLYMGSDSKDKGWSPHDFVTSSICGSDRHFHPIITWPPSDCPHGGLFLHALVSSCVSSGHSLWITSRTNSHGIATWIVDDRTRLRWRWLRCWRRELCKCPCGDVQCTERTPVLPYLLCLPPA